MKLKGIHKGIEAQQQKGETVRPDEEDPLTRYLEGMGTATARILINRHLDENLLEEYGLKELKNKGRYYIAKIVEPDGSLVDEVLIDKQSGTIQSLRRKTNIKN